MTPKTSQIPTPATLGAARAALSELNAPNDAQFEPRAEFVARYLREEEDGGVTALSPIDGSAMTRSGRPGTVAELVRDLLSRPEGRSLRWTLRQLV